jgi:membrane protein DedA with SNARE-associated domain
MKMLMRMADIAFWGTLFGAVGYMFYDTFKNQQEQFAVALGVSVFMFLITLACCINHIMCCRKNKE